MLRRDRLGGFRLAESAEHCRGDGGMANSIGMDEVGGDVEVGLESAAGLQSLPDRVTGGQKHAVLLDGDRRHPAVHLGDGERLGRLRVFRVGRDRGQRRHPRRDACPQGGQQFAVAAGPGVEARGTCVHGRRETVVHAEHDDENVGVATEGLPNIDVLHVEKRLLLAALLLDVLPAADRLTAATEWHHGYLALGPCGVEARLEEVDESSRADVHPLAGDTVADEDDAVTVAHEGR